MRECHEDDHADGKDHEGRRHRIITQQEVGWERTRCQDRAQPNVSGKENGNEPDGQDRNQRSRGQSDQDPDESRRSLATTKFVPKRVDMADYGRDGAGHPQPIPSYLWIHWNPWKVQGRNESDSQHSLGHIDEHDPSGKTRALGPEGVGATGIAAPLRPDINAPTEPSDQQTPEHCA